MYAVGVSAVGSSGQVSPHWVLVRGIQMRDLVPPAFTSAVEGTPAYDDATGEFVVNITVSLSEQSDIAYGVYVNAGCDS